MLYSETCHLSREQQPKFMVLSQVGCRDAIQHGAISKLVDLLSDLNPDVRQAAFRALLAASRFECCRNAVVQLNTALGVLVQLAAHGQDAAQAAAALQLLNACVQVGGWVDGRAWFHMLASANDRRCVHICAASACGQG